MRIVDDIEQGSPEWYDLRAGVLTASEFATMQAGGKGITRKKLLYKLANERLRQRSCEDGFSSRYMDRGKEREPEGMGLYEFVTGNEVRQVAFVYADDERIGCSPDGLVGDDGGVELKCPGLTAHTDYLLEKRLPPVYRHQVHGGMLVTGRQWWDFVSYCPESHVPLFRVRVERDEKACTALSLAAQLFLSDLDEMTMRLSTLEAA